MWLPLAIGVTILALGLSEARAEVPLSAYGDAEGYIDAHKLTCAQLANLNETDASLLNTWYNGWYNGLNHKHFLHYRNGTLVRREITTYCKEHPDKRIIDSIAAVYQNQRAPLAADKAPLKSTQRATPANQIASQGDKVRIKIDTGGPAGEGEGTLTHNGSAYALVVRGIGIGKSSVGGEIEGFVHNLRSPGDIVGTYGAGGAGFTIIGGNRVAQLRNEKGAMIELHAVRTDQEMNLNLAGMTIALK
jgi:hypothetical protein